ncbi:type I-E CRISPR-associated protein Cas7/Cse4/CasC [Thermus scotoductus]|uniref:Type I-E CRISPR-associated protein Cas7/Cse4/CasC n=1 Tax=Thermus scotoductus TaxID=37636 RepID=A0A430RAT1_THESC|nr:type I-E CRISPR-associated protein Cas7/Cse4/CasC [Thermus scotoductus]RTG99253.1 type I-E CRISPR-associated protein Cas7/Cse4/CasC [Thermus scotoductus]RTH04496.1 type I-E CRISPR-associated protein Cas7/Cse4/CasC [Thermus scotoductus]RTH22402.1 type I-E CRISPR-associated protein Cas7/Cse4/CasC [Thermus scotoductus]RTI08243.1 type I-E CRISPR-associated protein Cas7/Cse4/CasC [Thermus scotoductus]RTI10388.1 type I-E CRISPR-associated protein Cas7/Cse4/CasC [Thermus scotoductus]
MKLLEVHILQTVAPSNLNRDDTGSPKDALFGGFRRARISSQAQKRAVRVAFKEWPLLSEEERAVRTKRLVEELLQRLHGVEEGLARRAVENALNAMGFGVKENRTEYLLFLGHRELDEIARLIQENLEALSGEVKGKKKAEVDSGLKEALEGVLNGGKAVDLALFGRMLADRPELGVDAAAQVAHALSTHKVDREFDFYTAVDDLNPKEETGAGMMGDVEFYSATLYRYALVDLEKLSENLQGDKELALKGALAFLEAFALTLPSGKQNSFAAHNPPLFVAFRAGEGLPRNLATAFERPIRPREDQSLSCLSVEALLKEWEKFDRVYGPLNPEWKGALDLTEAKGDGLPRLTSLEELKGKVREAVGALLGV